MKEVNLDSNKSTEEEAAPQIAFKDFKNAITNNEFLAVQALAEKEYTFLVKVLEKKKEFESKINDSESILGNSVSEMPPGLADKLLAGLARRATKDLMKHNKEEIDRHVSVVDFLNRFRASDDVLEYLDFSFLKKQ